MDTAIQGADTVTRHWIWIISAALVLTTATSATAQDAVEPEQPATEQAQPAGEAADSTADMSAGAVDLTCADIAALEEAHAAALVYYVAGYADAMRDAAAGSLTPPNNGMPGGLTLSAAAVISDCANAPDERIADVVAALGGSMGERASQTPPPADEPAAEPTGDEAPADEVPAPEGEPMEEPAPADDAAEPSTDEPAASQ